MERFTLKRGKQKSLEMFDALFSTAAQGTPANRVAVQLDQEKTNIQTASKARSYEGLLVHAFGRLAAAMFIMASNS
jgi:hypothetical protein